MAFTSGTAATWTDLLTALHDFVTGDPGTPGRDWTEAMALRECANPTLAGHYEVVYQNTGISGLETVIVGIREYHGTLRQGWTLNVYPIWVAGQDWNDNYPQHAYTTYNTTYNGYSYHPCIPLLPDTMPYWFVSNKQRIMGIIKTGSTYQSFYLGFGNRLGTSAMYPTPLYAAGSGWGLIDVTDVTNYHQYCIHPRNYWDNESGYTNETSYMVVGPANSFLNLVTRMDYCRTIPHNYQGYNGYGLIWQCGRDTNGAWQIYPVYIVSQSYGAMFSLDGMCHVPGNALQAEDELKINGEQWLLFPNVFRTSNGNWMAMYTGASATWTTTSTTTTTTTTTAA